MNNPLKWFGKTLRYARGQKGGGGGVVLIRYHAHFLTKFTCHVCLKQKKLRITLLFSLFSRATVLFSSFFHASRSNFFPYHASRINLLLPSYASRYVPVKSVMACGKLSSLAQNPFAIFDRGNLCSKQIAQDYKSYMPSHTIKPLD